MKKTLFLLALLTLGTSLAQAQDTDATSHDKWFFGLGGGLRWGGMHFSDIDEDMFPDDKNLPVSPVFSVFVERNFGSKGSWGVRPEITWVRRGGTIGGIYSGLEDYEGMYEYYGLSDVRYRLKANYIDLRVPVFYQFGNRESKFRPYVFAAPVFGLVTSGSIRAEDIYENGYYEGVRLDATKANLAQTYFGLQAGLGVKWFFNAGRHRVYLGADVSYEFGLTDTYGSDEKDGTAIVRDETFYTAYDIQGTRKFRGLEARLSVGIPLSVFSKRKAAPQPVYTYDVPAYTQPVYTPPVYTPPVVQMDEQPQHIEVPCNSFEEISDMIDRGEDVKGKTFCAVEGINFEYGKSNILPSSYTYLNRLADILQRTGMKIEVRGHTDNRGSARFNMNLSRARAQAVVEYLAQRGVDRANLSYSYYGMSRPLVSNDTEEGRAINRRVEFEILNK
ncbi:MAG: OmpA family protein [Bacteroidaceae bacterium]|nr:OmpA family protein [Bacteroidaceae bacterium]